MILAAYDEGGGYRDAAARRLGVRANTLQKINRQLGITGMVQARTGHYPGWMGSKAWDFRATIPRRPHRSKAWIDARYDR